MTTKPDDDIAAFLAAWTTAETARDVKTLDRQLAPDFTGIGPLGFTLTKTNRLDRHATGARTYNTYRLEELHPRAYGDTAVVTALKQRLPGKQTARLEFTRSIHYLQGALFFMWAIHFTARRTFDLRNHCRL